MTSSRSVGLAVLVTLALFASAGCCSPDPLPVHEPSEYLEWLDATIGGEPATVSVSSARVDGKTIFPVQIASARAIISFSVGERPTVRVGPDRVEIGAHVLEFADQGATLRYEGTRYELAPNGAYMFGGDGVFLGRVR